MSRLMVRIEIAADHDHHRHRSEHQRKGRQRTFDGTTPGFHCKLQVKKESVAPPAREATSNEVPSAKRAGAASTHAPQSAAGGSDQDNFSAMQRARQVIWVENHPHG